MRKKRPPNDLYELNTYAVKRLIPLTIINLVAIKISIARSCKKDLIKEIKEIVMKKRISCDAHDHFEIICMRRSEVMLTTKENIVYTGVAVDIKIQDNQELLKIQSHNNYHYIALTDVKKLAAINAKYPNNNFEVQW